MEIRGDGREEHGAAENYVGDVRSGESLFPRRTSNGEVERLLTVLDLDRLAIAFGVFGDELSDWLILWGLSHLRRIFTCIRRRGLGRGGDERSVLPGVNLI